MTKFPRTKFRLWQKCQGWFWILAWIDILMTKSMLSALLKNTLFAQCYIWPCNLVYSENMIILTFRVRSIRIKEAYDARSPFAFDLTPRVVCVKMVGALLEVFFRAVALHVRHRVVSIHISKVRPDCWVPAIKSKVSERYNRKHLWTFICFVIVLWRFLCRLFPSKHLKGKLGIRFRDFTFSDERRSVGMGPCVSEDTFLNQARSVGVLRQWRHVF